MLTEFRRKLGRLKDQLERHAETIGSGGKRAAPAPISGADEGLLLDWITAKIDDAALFEHARTQAGGLALLERARDMRSGSQHVWAELAQRYLDLGRIEEAVEHAERAFVLGRPEPAIGLLFVKALVAAGEPDAALEVLPVALDNARRTSAHAMRLELCAIWKALQPGSIEPLLESARTRVAGGDLEAAIAEFEALRTRFGPRPDILLPLAAVYQDLVRTQDAMRVYLAAVEASPDNVDALCMAGACARDLGELQSAERLLSRGVELDPRSPFAQYNLGLLRLDQERIDEAARLILGARAATRGEPWSAETLAEKLIAPREIDPGDLEWANARFKVLHDIEQLAYLRLHDKAGPGIDPIIAEYQAIIADPLLPIDAYRMVALDPKKYPLLARSYKAPLHAPDPEPPQGPLINPDLKWGEIEERYLDAKPGLVHIDELLSPDALAAIRAYCLESTIWNQLKGGYLGAYMPDGFSGRLLLRIASELRRAMPRVIRNLPLQTMWGYKYDSRYSGIGLHADVAAVNVNFWITPDEANLDPDSGGLIVYTHDAPRDWSFQRFNADPAAIRAYLESVGAAKVKVPYRANRAVIFDSDLFHETDAFRFRDGYENRRINVTLLYGTRAA